jgi:hypothetical protein
MEAKSQPEGNKSGQVGAISFNLTSGYEPCVFFSKTPENDNLIASSSAHCSPDCSARLIYSATRMDITSGRPVRAINLWRPFLQQMVIKERKWRCEEVTLVINMAAHGSSHATDQAGSQYRGHKKKIINTDTPFFSYDIKISDERRYQSICAILCVCDSQRLNSDKTRQKEGNAANLNKPAST